MRRGAALLTLALAGCGDSTAGDDADQTGVQDGAVEHVQLPAWGPSARPAGELEAKLLAAELRRDPADPSIAQALASDDPHLRRRGAYALAHIGGPEALRRLATLVGSPEGGEGLGALALLDPPRDAPREAAKPSGAWAALEDALWSRYAVTEDGSAEVEPLLIAIARVGGPRSVERLAADVARPPVGSGHERYASAMTSLAVLCSRGHALTEDARDAVAGGLSSADAPARLASEYALGRCARSSAEVLALANEREVLVDRLTPLLERGPEEQRMVWKAFAGLGELPTQLPDNVLAADPPEWMAEVEAVRALTRSPSGQKLVLERLSTLGLGQMNGPRFHAVLEALRGLRDSAGSHGELTTTLDALRTEIRATRPKAPEHDQHALALVACEVELLGAVADGKLDALLGCARDSESIPPELPEVLAVEALLLMGDAMGKEERVAGLLRRAEDSRPAVAAPALAALAEIDDPRANEVLRAALGGLDVGVVSAAATAIASRAVDASKRDPLAAPALIRTVKQLSNAEAVEARIAAIEGLGSLGRSAAPAVGEGKAVVAPTTPEPWLTDVIMPLRTDPNVAVRRVAREALLGHDELLQQFDAGASAGDPQFGAHLQAALDENAGVTGLRVATSAGEFVIDFRNVPAPINQANLSDLAKKGFYDGIRWHRVVPDFVIQGGDPRGDGYGGPGHLVPCEWSNLRYERGTVGIALAGQDTGGSQMFVTHSPQPHLDARYTIVGRVTQGMEVVDRMMPGDTIVSVTPVEGAP